MKKKILVTLVMIFSLVSVNAQKIAIGPVLDLAVYDDSNSEYVLASKDLVDNPYTNIVIQKVGHILKFKVFTETNEVIINSVYKIEKRKAGRRVIIATKIDDGSGDIIKVIQKKHTTEIHCQYNKETDRYDGVFIIGELDFVKLKNSDIAYLDLD